MEAELYRGRVYFFDKHYGATAALGLKALVYSATLMKILVHHGLRLVTVGHRGRSVTSWRELRQALSRVDVGPRERTVS